MTDLHDEGSATSASVSRNWFGFPRTLGASLAETTAEFLGKLWVIQQGTPLGPIERDIQRLQRWFDPTATGKRIRRELGGLQPASGRPEHLDQPFVYEVDDERQLLTPEGRWLYELLRRGLAGRSETFSLPAAGMAEAEASLIAAYRRWSFQRIDDVVGMQRGDAAPLLPQGLGQVLLLLMSDAVGESQALRLPADPAGREAVDDALTTCVEAFADALAPSDESRGRNRRHFSLYSGYAVSEAARRLGGRLVHSKTATYLTEGSEQQVIRRVAAELCRRPEEQRQNIELAMTALLREYERSRPVLAAWGLAHASPSRPTSIRNQLTSALAEAAD